MAHALVPLTQIREELQISKPTLLNYLKELGFKQIQQGRLSYITLPEYEIVAALKSTLKKGEAETIAGAKAVLRAGGLYIPKTPAELAEPDGWEAEEEDTALTKHASNPKKQAIGTDIFSFLSSLLPEVFSLLGREIGFSIQQKSTSEQSIIDLDLLDRRYELLEKSVEKNRKLPTSELAQILGLSPKTLSARKQTERYGFTFYKAGKSGNESLWVVVRPENND